MPDMRPAWGSTNYIDRVIQVADADRTQKRLTILHEFWHVYYRLHGLEQNEDQIHELSQRMYFKMYGV